MGGFDKILVANRGEIARRVFRTCREHEIATVAIYSEADRGALHVADADEAVCVGPAAAARSYLDIDAIIAAARRTGAAAIHPGYGFLSEQARFAKACDAAGIVFIGPSAHAMELMGDKQRARATMTAAGVPVVPGRSDLQHVADAEAAAAEIGFPIMLKAAAGGGGKGMRIVDRPADVGPAFEASAREAKAAFGDGRVFVERAIMDARHVEIQVMADGHGNIVSLGERDCSVQRRHQKVIEETPSPSPQMNESVRGAMGDVAVAAAAAVDYRGAGTVEFLFEETPDGARFYFLEMNTRLQVEHAVTEAITGRDLVWDQIRVASGEPLGYTQTDVHRRGHAIECRIYAEDPKTYLPRPGRIRVVRWPQGAGLRIDTAVTSGSEVSSHYDPMIAKVTCWGRDRADALTRMRRALDDTCLLGIDTNLDLHRAVLREPDFIAGAAVTTRYLDTHRDVLPWSRVGRSEAVEGDPDPAADVAWAVAAAAGVRAARARAASMAAFKGGSVTESSAHPDPDGPSAPWRRSARWRS